MRVQMFNPERDYAVLEKWWKAHKWNAMPLDHLPATGLMAWEAESPVCAVFLYLTGTALAVLECFISDPESDAEVRARAIALLIAQIKAQAKSCGVSTLMGAAKSNRLTEKLKEGGFEVINSGITNLVARI